MRANLWFSRWMSMRNTPSRLLIYISIYSVFFQIDAILLEEELEKFMSTILTFYKQNHAARHLCFKCGRCLGMYMLGVSIEIKLICWWLIEVPPPFVGQKLVHPSSCGGNSKSKFSTFIQLFCGVHWWFKLFKLSEFVVSFSRTGLYTNKGFFCSPSLHVSINLQRSIA